MGRTKWNALAFGFEVYVERARALQQNRSLEFTRHDGDGDLMRSDLHNNFRQLIYKSWIVNLFNCMCHIRKTSFLLSQFYNRHNIIYIVESALKILEFVYYMHAFNK